MGLEDVSVDAACLQLWGAGRHPQTCPPPCGAARNPGRRITIARAWNKYFGAAKRRFWPTGIHLKPKSEVYWERAGSNQRNYHFYLSDILKLKERT